MSRGFREFGAELTENPLGIESCDDAGLNTPRGMTGVIAAADLEGFAHSAAAQDMSAYEVTHEHWAAGGRFEARIRNDANSFMGVLSFGQFW